MGQRLKAGTASRAVVRERPLGGLAVYVFSIDARKCERCFDCVTSCPREVFQTGETRPVVVHPEECMGCGVCLAVCRTQSLRISGMLPSTPLECLPVVA